jgi:hypothetical protein
MSFVVGEVQMQRTAEGTKALKEACRDDHWGDARNFIC